MVSTSAQSRKEKGAPALLAQTSSAPKESALKTPRNTPESEQKSPMNRSPAARRTSPATPSTFVHAAPHISTPKVSRFSNFANAGSALSFPRSATNRVTFGTTTFSNGDQEQPLAQPSITKPVYRRGSQGRSARPRFSFFNPRSLSMAATSSPSTPGKPSPKFIPSHPGGSTKTKITVCSPTLKAAQHVMKRQRGILRKIRDLSRLLLHVVDQVQDWEEAANKANDGIQWEATSFNVAKEGMEQSYSVGVGELFEGGQNGRVYVCC